MVIFLFTVLLTSWFRLWSRLRSRLRTNFRKSTISKDRNRRAQIAALILLLPVQSAYPALTDIEYKIIQQVAENEAAARELLEEVVNINSGTMNLEGVREVGKRFDRAFKHLGFKTRWIDGTPFQRAGHLIATHGNAGPKLLLIGHLDTVFTRDSPLKRYQELANNKVKGPGITDMKGGDVVMLYALAALKGAGALDRISVTIILTGDEERRGRPLKLAIHELVKAGRWADFAIGFEDGDGDPSTAVISRRGSTRWQLTVTGRAAHSSQIFREDYGYGAIYETARILNDFRETLSTEPNLTFNPGLILGGTEVNTKTGANSGQASGKNNVIAKTTLVRGDIRALTPAQLSKAQTVMQRITADNLNKTSAQLEFFDGYPPMAPRENNRRLLNIYDQISQDLGFGKVNAVDPRNAGAADISFVAEHVEMAIDGLGLMGSGGHTENEIADMNTLLQQTQRAAILFHRLADRWQPRQLLSR